ncbi:MAG: MBL fold metallo-hydrolase [Clostridiaceae bacterium]|jgi:glyoxylase-like metal-dependent hydrolase (beta-lactamase superfamily II)|nr:MBL fold metallo-hydrolase [Clostridiaceae bacterium]
MFIECIPSGLVQSNVYMVSGNGEAVIIDCGCNPDTILNLAGNNMLTVKHVILTHGHFDHIYYTDALREKADVQVHIHEADANCLVDPYLNGMALFPVKGTKTFHPADHLLKDGDILECGGLSYHIIHTPGHSKGSICIHVGNALFTGDTLFHTSIGRTDLPGGSMEDIEKSIREKLYSLQDETAVYPGHGVKTSIGYEKKHNPYYRIKK